MISGCLPFFDQVRRVMCVEVFQIFCESKLDMAIKTILIFAKVVNKSYWKKSGNTQILEIFRGQRNIKNITCNCLNHFLGKVSIHETNISKKKHQPVSSSFPWRLLGKAHLAGVGDDSWILGRNHVLVGPGSIGEDSVVG